MVMYSMSSTVVSVTYDRWGMKEESEQTDETQSAAVNCSIRPLGWRIDALTSTIMKSVKRRSPR